MGAANCLGQTNALFRKNLVIQRRDCKTNCCLICFPSLVCLLLGGAQIAMMIYYLRSVADRARINCGYCTVSTNIIFSKNTVGGLVCPTECPLPIAPKWPPVLQLPMTSDLELEVGLSVPTNLVPKSRAARFLVTGSNQSFAESVMSNMFPKHDSLNSAADISTLADFALGTNAMRLVSLGADEYGSDFDEHSHLFFLQNNCIVNSTLSFPVQEGRSNFTKDATCTEGLFLWHENLSVMNNELYRGYNHEDDKTSKIASAYDLTSSDLNKFNLIVSYNPTKKGVTEFSVLLFSLSFPPILLRVPRLLNLVSNAYIQSRGNATKMRFEFVKDMPRAAQLAMPPDISFLLGKLVFVWIIMLLFPVILSNLVYEKQHKLRTMMKMHGLGDMAYWTISYIYFLLLSLLYMLCLVLFGSIVGKMIHFTIYEKHSINIPNKNGMS